MPSKIRPIKPQQLRALWVAAYNGSVHAGANAIAAFKPYAIPVHHHAIRALRSKGWIDENGKVTLSGRTVMGKCRRCHGTCSEHIVCRCGDGTAYTYCKKTPPPDVNPDPHVGV